MPRFIFRFTGAGAKPAGDVEKIRASTEASVVAESDRMILLEASESKAAKLQNSLKEWSMCAEQSIPLPDPWPKLRKPTKS